jgi:hypothetical protein
LKADEDQYIRNPEGAYFPHPMPDIRTLDPFEIINLESEAKIKGLVNFMFKEDRTRMLVTLELQTEVGSDAEMVQLLEMPSCRKLKERKLGKGHSAKCTPDFKNAIVWFEKFEIEKCYIYDF